MRLHRQSSKPRLFWLAGVLCKHFRSPKTPGTAAPSSEGMIPGTFYRLLPGTLTKRFRHTLLCERVQPTPSLCQPDPVNQWLYSYTVGLFVSYSVPQTISSKKWYVCSTGRCLLLLPDFNDRSGEVRGTNQPSQGVNGLQYEQQRHPSKASERARERVRTAPCSVQQYEYSSSAAECIVPPTNPATRVSIDH